MVWQDLDPVGFLWDFRDRIYHVDCKDTRKRMVNGRNGRLGSHLAWADPPPRLGLHLHRARRRALGGRVPHAQHHRLPGPISIEWEDAGMDRLLGAPEAIEFVRRLAFDAPDAAFDAAFSTKAE